MHTYANNLGQFLNKLITILRAIHSHSSVYSTAQLWAMLIGWSLSKREVVKFSALLFWITTWN